MNLLRSIINHKHQISCILMLMIVIVFPAKSASENLFDLGINVGMGCSSIDYPGSIKNPSWVGAYRLGTHVRLRAIKCLNIGSGIGVQKDGYYEKSISYYNDIPIGVRFSVYRLSIPLFIQLQPFSKIPIYGILGLNNYFNLDMHKKISPIPEGFNYSFGRINNYNCNIEVGIGCQLLKNISIEINYERGLNSIYKNNSGFYSNIISASFKMDLTTF